MNINALTNVSSPYITQAAENASATTEEEASFDTFLSSAMGLVNETNDLQNTAESAEIQFALGQMDNTHDLQVAQEEANIALQYTVAVRDNIIEAYNTIMNMQM
ncbi:flagellar hook-basal body complex protein FliE [Eubacterium oxidoreducens]|uniref:Flagellar hook-basal body complex protein FliE n=1 Tax=Eubacterium oxidoreducens TaxID=1732 RepID=A0A1G6AQV2_EUBOX|nr:flagellar hook-basal body complex protein FliE [Eubacterium oxidoreducens]SDB10573.1 flagellar hook-basal body complex protein FliE [Eubacterium oxidoreducens]